MNGKFHVIINDAAFIINNNNNNEVRVPVKSIKIM